MFSGCLLLNGVHVYFCHPKCTTLHIILPFGPPSKEQQGTLNPSSPAHGNELIRVNFTSKIEFIMRLEKEKSIITLHKPSWLPLVTK